MKNKFKCSSLIRVAVIIVVMAFMALQITGTYAQGNQGNQGNIQTKLDEILAEVQKPPAGVPKTGQTTQHEPRDDGDLERGVEWPNPRFTDNGNGTITDNLTHLIWDKDANRFGTSTWANALSDCNGLADNGGDLTDGSQAGDWFLPNRKEILTLIHLGVFSPAVPDTSGTGHWSQGDPFNNVQSGGGGVKYWTSTAAAGSTQDRWGVDFGDGDVNNIAKANNWHVWCVRGGQ